MKIQVEHDDRGVILSVAATVAGTGTTTLQPGPGRQVSVVDAPDVKDANDLANLRQVRQAFRVDGLPGQARLVRK